VAAGDRDGNASDTSGVSDTSRTDEESFDQSHPHVGGVVGDREVVWGDAE
jgi:hypothetical protein